MFKYKKLNKLIFGLFIVYTIGILFISVHQVNHYKNTFIDILNEISGKFCNLIADVFKKHEYIITAESFNNFYKQELIEHIHHFDIVNVKIFDKNKQIVFDSHTDDQIKNITDIFSNKDILMATKGQHIGRLKFINVDHIRDIRHNNIHTHDLYNNKYNVIYQHLYVIHHTNDYTYEKSIKGFMVTSMDITHKYIILHKSIQRVYIIGILSILFIIFTLLFFMYMYATMLDNDEKLRLKLEVALNESRSANILKDKFLATVSHEMRTPIQSIIGFLEIVYTDIEEKLTQYGCDKKTCDNFILKTLENINISLRSSEDLLFLINNILDYSKITANRFTLDNITFNFFSMCDQLFDMFKISAIKKNINFVCKKGDGIPRYVIGDKNRIKQILINLINNAIKFTPSGGNIEISVHIYNNSIDEKNVVLLFTIKDDGIGITSDYQELVFKPFVQASNTSVVGGTGLGLTISRELVLLMGGNIWFESQSNQGTTFYFTIKLGIGSQEDVKYTDIVDTTNYISNHERSLQILLVDDDKFIQQYIKKMLSKYEHIITIANNGVEAIEILSKSKFDLIIMDKQMPELDGIETSIIIRNKTTSVLDHDVPILAMTAMSLEKDKQLWMQAGVNDIIIKPVKSIDLLTSIYKLVQKNI